MLNLKQVLVLLLAASPILGVAATPQSGGDVLSGGSDSTSGSGSTGSGSTGSSGTGSTGTGSTGSGSSGSSGSGSTGSTGSGSSGSSSGNSLTNQVASTLNNGSTGSTNNGGSSSGSGSSGSSGSNSGTGTNSASSSSTTTSAQLAAQALNAAAGSQSSSTTTTTTAAAAAAAAATTAPALGNWQPIWHEYFSIETTSLSAWQFDIGTGYPGGAAHWGTNEVEYMTNSMFVLDQNYGLGLYALKGAANGQWYSTRIETVRSDLVAKPGGAMYVYANIFLPNLGSGKMQGMWPAFWMMGNQQKKNRNGWPACGEIDIMEQVNGDGNWHFGVHCDVTPGGACNENNGIGSSVTYNRNSWNKFGVLINLNVVPGRWQDEEIVWHVNDQPVWSIKGSQFYPDHYSAWQSLAQNPMFIILDVAVGGDWPGNPNANTVNGYEMWVWDVAYWQISPITPQTSYNSPSTASTSSSSTTSSGSTTGSKLKRRGAQRSYSLPEVSESDKEFLKKNLPEMIQPPTINKDYLHEQLRRRHQHHKRDAN